MDGRSSWIRGAVRGAEHRRSCLAFCLLLGNAKSKSLGRRTSESSAFLNVKTERPSMSSPHSDLALMRAIIDGWRPHAQPIRTLARIAQHQHDIDYGERSIKNHKSNNAEQYLAG